MVKIKEVIVVEGRYDKNTLSQIVDATIITLGGFSVFNDKEKLAFLRRLAEKQGLIVLTDSDAAGFVIRDRIAAAIPKEQLLHAYIPQRRGKESRKREASKEGLLGVEGMEATDLLAALRAAGATMDGVEAESPTPYLTAARMMEDGLTGGTDSKKKREALCRALELPAYLSTSRLMAVLNAAVSERDYLEALKNS
jgi:ribonuclease M5